MKDLSKYDSVTVEPSRGATYCEPGKFNVYGYSTYDRSSVLAGQTMRCYIQGGYDSVEAALKDYPTATPSGCRYQPPYLGHLPDPDGPDPLGDNADIDREMRMEAMG